MRTVQTIANYTPEEDMAPNQKVFNLSTPVETPMFVRSPSLMPNRYVLRKPKSIDDTTDWFRVNRMATTPDVLKAVGLCRHPKTYSKKDLTLADKDRFKTTMQIVFCTYADFGYIDFENEL